MPTATTLSTYKIKELLCVVPIFKALDEPEAAFEWMLGRGEVECYKEGEYIFKAGDKIDSMRVLLEGEVGIYFRQNDETKLFDTWEAGDISGKLPYSRLQEAKGEARAEEDCIMLSIHEQYFQELCNVDDQLMGALVHLMADRIREFTRNRTQTEKLMSLGKLSAGLAHELNNPASAVVRSAYELREQVHKTPDKFKAITTLRFPVEKVDAINEILFEKINGDISCDLSMLKRRQKKKEIVKLLRSYGIPNPEAMAQTFLDANFHTEEVERMHDILEGEHIPEVFNWVESTLNIEVLLLQLTDGADRIASLIKSIKTYSHMDRGTDRDRTDLHKNLRSTLTMLNHKTKKKQIEVVEEFDERIGEACLYVSEANQMWTNLIDNAIDAMEQGGTLTVTTRRHKDKIIVQIQDTGTGIDQDHIDNIWEPFYTTKGIGEGTGMGLDVVYRIVQKHKGNIKVESEPGNTVFTVTLPAD